MRTPVGIAMLSLTALLAAPAARAQCPSTTLTVVGLGTQSTNEKYFDVTYSELSWVQGDHRTGQYSLQQPGSLGPNVITARDGFDVIGVPAGTPVDVILAFVIEGSATTLGCGGGGCCGSLVATVRAGPDTANATFIGQTWSGTATFGGAVVLPVTLTAGTPRNLEVEMYARRCPGGSHTVEASGRIVFQGTNPDAYVVSCKGYGPKTIPVLRRSWGELKTIYR